MIYSDSKEELIIHSEVRCRREPKAWVFACCPDLVSPQIVMKSHYCLIQRSVDAPVTRLGLSQTDVYNPDHICLS